MELLRAWPLVAAYLVGSLSFSILLSRWRGGDIRERDAAGASGAARQYGLLAGVAVGLLDIAKGAGAVLLARAYAPGLAFLAPLAVVAGHCWPLYFGFRGGQGLAPAIGATLALAPGPLAASLAVGLAALGLHRSLRLGRFVGLRAIPFATLPGLVALLAAAWRLEGGAVLGGLALMAAAMGLRGLQVLRGPKALAQP